MTKFTKITAAALFAMFLTACDKPTSNTENTQASVPTADSVQTANVTEAQGIEDFKKIVEWNKSQEKDIVSAQADLQQKLATQDKAQIEEGFNTFRQKVDAVLKSLDAVEVKHPDVANFKAKTKETIALSNELIADSVKAMASPTEELQASIQEETQKFLQASEELQKLQLELQQKFTSK